MSKDNDTFFILVKEIAVDRTQIDFPLCVYQVESEFKGGSWTECFATIERCLAYLRGIHNVTASAGIKVVFEPGSKFDMMP